MQGNRKTINPEHADRMGRFIGQMRVHEGITLAQLAHGLCSVPFLNRIENGEREVGKLMTDAFFQRLGKPVELFERILDWDEFQQWSHRQEIIRHLRRGDIAAARAAIRDYLSEKADVLNRQFAAMIEIDCRHLEGAEPQELLPMVCGALELTQPDFQTTPPDDLLLSQNEGRLLFAYYQLKEQPEGFDAVSESYSALLQYFKQSRYESRERVYLTPYVACRVIENEYAHGRYREALTICEDTLAELTAEHRLFAYDKLLQWKQKLLDAMGSEDRTPEKLLAQLKLILEYAPMQADLLIPIDERGHVYCLNQVIRDRRKLLGISQEELAEGICAPHTLSRIENRGGNLHRKNRRALLQRVNMSGERYDYEVITDRYEDYLLRSELGRAYYSFDTPRAFGLLEQLRKNLPDIPTNHQYVIDREATLNEELPEDHPDRISLQVYCERCREALRVTLPYNLDKIESWPITILSLNELLILINYGFSLKQQKNFSYCLSVLEYARSCLVNTGTDMSFYEDLYTRIISTVASALGDMGQYEKSNLLARTCIELAINSQNSVILSNCLFGIAWNVSKQGETFESKREDAVSLLKLACSAALISGDTVEQQLISRYSLRTYNIDPSL